MKTFLTQPYKLVSAILGAIMILWLIIHSVFKWLAVASGGGNPHVIIGLGN